MVNDLIDRKREISDNTFKRMNDAINNINERIDSAMKDSGTKISGDLSILNQLKTVFSFDRTKAVNMNSTDKLAYAKEWFQSKQNDVNTLKDIASEQQKSLLNDIDQEIARVRTELADLDRQLQDETNPERRSMLNEERDKRESEAVL